MVRNQDPSPKVDLLPYAYIKLSQKMARGVDSKKNNIRMREEKQRNQP